MSGITSDRNDPGLKKVLPNGQLETYLVIPEDDRQRGCIRPVRSEYVHKACGNSTRMGLAIAETYAKNPKFYDATFCCRCGKHFPLIDAETQETNFLWLDGSAVGS